MVLYGYLPPGGGEGPARGARAPVPTGCCGGGAARGAFSRRQGMPRRGGRQRGALVGGQGGLETGFICGSVGGEHTRRIDIQYIEPAGGRGGDPRAPAACPHRFRGGCRGRASPPTPGSQGRGRRRGALECWSHCAHVSALLHGPGPVQEARRGVAPAARAGVARLGWRDCPQQGVTLGPGAGSGP